MIFVSPQDMMGEPETVLGTTAPSPFNHLGRKVPVPDPTVCLCALPVNEEWRPLVGYEGYYLISNYGRIRGLIGPRGSPRHKSRLVKWTMGDRGYWSVCLQRANVRKTEMVHVLVARTFIGPCPEGHLPNHIDTHKDNPCVWNLEYLTPSENTLHAYEMGVMNAKGERNGRAKLDPPAAMAVVKMLDEGQTQRQIAATLDIDQATVSDISTGRTWSHLTGRTYRPANGGLVKNLGA